MRDNWLATESPVIFDAGLVVSPKDSGQRFDFVIRNPTQSEIFVWFELLDHDRLRRFSIDQSHGSIISIGPKQPLHAPVELLRVIELLGDAEFGFGSLEFDNPTIVRGANYCSVSLIPIDMNAEGSTALLGRKLNTNGRRYIERPMDDLGMGEQGSKVHYGFLSTSQQIEARLAELIAIGRQQHVLPEVMDCEATTDAVHRIYFKLLGGYDSWLLDERI